MNKAFIYIDTNKMYQRRSELILGTMKIYMYFLSILNTRNA